LDLQTLKREGAKRMSLPIMINIFKGHRGFWMMNINNRISIERSQYLAAIKVADFIMNEAPPEDMIFMTYVREDKSQRCKMFLSKNARADVVNNPDRRRLLIAADIIRGDRP
jgi:hypothetical protein